MSTNGENGQTSRCTYVRPMVARTLAKIKQKQLEIAQIGIVKHEMEQITFRGINSRSSYVATISLSSALLLVHRISTKARSSVPIPLNALCNCLHRYSVGGRIRAMMKSSNFPVNSLFKSSMRSRPYSRRKYLAISWRCLFERAARIAMMASSSVPKPFIAARNASPSSAALKFGIGTIVGETFNCHGINAQILSRKWVCFCYHTILASEKNIPIRKSNPTRNQIWQKKIACKFVYLFEQMMKMLSHSAVFVRLIENCRMHVARNETGT